jgi:murein DD-endopeptidase MepM/ murein hydrolase activator NlpD
MTCVQASLKVWLGYLISLLFVGTVCAAPVLVTIDTPLLGGTSAQLAFDLIDGGPPASSVSISSFATNGTLGAATVVGGVSGTLPGTVTLTDSDFFNEYLQDITLGTELSFVLDASFMEPDTGGFSDSFSFFLLDPATGLSLAATSDPTGADSLIFADVGGLVTYASSAFSVTLQPVQAISEPSTLLLSALVLLLLCGTSLRVKAIRSRMDTYARRFGAMLLFMLLGTAATAQPLEVTSQIEMSRSGLVLNRATNTYDQVVTIRNSLFPIQAPIDLVVETIDPPGVILANRTGFTADGKSYIRAAVSELAPGANTSILLKFANPQRVRFSYASTVWATVQPFRSTSAVLEIVGPQGKDITLGNATLFIPPGAFSAQSAVSMQIVAMPELESRMPEYFRNAQPLALPRLKIKSSAAPRLPLEIRLGGLPSGSEQAGSLLTFVMPVRQGGAYEEGIPTLVPLGGRVCGKERNALCGTLMPEHFQPVPGSPDDPVISIAGIRLSDPGPADLLAKGEDVRPLTLSTANTSPIKLEAIVLLEKAFEVASPTADDPARIGTGSPYITFRAGEKISGEHRANDLTSPNQSPVYSMLAGEITRVGIDFTAKPENGLVGCTLPDAYKRFELLNYRSGGYRISVLHSNNLEAWYMHLTPPVSTAERHVGDDLIKGQPLGSSGFSGVPFSKEANTCPPHLHLQLQYTDNQGPRLVDPWPLLQNDMALFLDPPHPSDSGIVSEPTFVLSAEVNGQRLATSTWPVNAFPISKTAGAFGGEARINFTDERTLGQFLGGTVLKAGDTAKLVLSLCTFRLGRCYDVAAWNITTDQGPLTSWRGKYTITNCQVVDPASGCEIIAGWGFSSTSEAFFWLSTAQTANNATLLRQINEGTSDWYIPRTVPFTATSSSFTIGVPYDRTTVRQLVVPVPGGGHEFPHKEIRLSGTASVNFQITNRTSSTMSGTFSASIPYVKRIPLPNSSFTMDIVQAQGQAQGVWSATRSNFFASVQPLGIPGCVRISTVGFRTFQGGDVFTDSWKSGSPCTVIMTPLQ